MNNPSQAELATAVEDNLHALFRAMAAVLPDSEIQENRSHCRHLTFPLNPMFKGVWQTRLAPEAVDDCIDETIDWFDSREAPFFFWWTSSRSEPKDLGARLAKRGLLSMAEQQKQFAPGMVQEEEGAPCMVANLHALNENALVQVPSGFAIDIVRDEQSLHDFSQVFVRSYGVPDWAAQAWIDATLTIGFDRAPWTIYVGRLQGEPVASNLLFNGGGVAGLFAVATVPSARGMGIGGAITLKPLLDARAQGYNHGVLFSTEMGIRVYERIGFVKTDFNINRYLWRRDS